MLKALALCVVSVAVLGACAGTPKELAGNERKECRSVEITGSKFPKEDCRTVEDWAKQDADEKARNEGLLGQSRQGVQP